MKYVDEFRNRELVEKTAARIREVAAGRTLTFMEVCGTHTMSIFRFGLREMLPENIRLISGPGCPVCVTPNSFLDAAIALGRMKDVIITTFGDMLRVPGSYSSLEKEKAKGRQVRVVYSTADALDIAKKNRGKEVVFLGVGFETTAPTVASSIIEAKRRGIGNYSVLCGHKTMPAALKALVMDKTAALDGFLLPGHVSAIIGTRPYDFLAKRYHKRCVVSGFEPLDIMQAMLMLAGQRKAAVEIAYGRAVHRQGNAAARGVIDKVFRPVSAEWRGIGAIPGSGLAIRKEFSDYDAAKRFDLKAAPGREDKRCICGQVLKGIKTPEECALFGKACTPAHPVGACMVSSEGTCAAYFKYGVERK